MKVDEDCAEVTTSEGKPYSRLEVQPLRKLERRLFSVSNAGRPVCDLTQIEVAYVSHSSSNAHCKSLAMYSGAVLLRRSGTQERPDGTQYVLGCAPVQITQQRCNMVCIKPLHTNLAAALTTDCRRSCKRRDIPMRFTLP